MLNYNVCLEIASLLFMLLFVVRFCLLDRFPNGRTRLFGLCLYSGTVIICLDLACLVLQTGLDIRANTVFRSFQLGLGMLYVCLFCNYCLEYCGIHLRRRPLIYILNGLVLAVLWGLLVANIYNGWLFFYDIDSRFVIGFKHWIIWAVFGWYSFWALTGLLIKGRRAVGRAALIVPLCVAVGAAVHVMDDLFSYQIVHGLGIAVGTMLVYIDLQRPGRDRDPLTGVYTRSLLFDYLGELSDNGISYPMVYVNLYGTALLRNIIPTEKRDALICRAASVLCGFSKKNIVFKYTVDGFIVVVTEPGRLEAYKSYLTDRLRNMTSDIDGIPVETRLMKYCIPVAEKPVTGDVLSRAVGAIYSSLPSSGQTDGFPDLELPALQRSIRRQEVLRALRRAIDRSNVSVMIQPIIDSATSETVACEALARITDPELGFISPGDFIPVAEETGLITQLSLQVLRRVCRFLKSLPPEAYARLNSVSVNLSIADCVSRTQCERICRTVDEYGLDPGKIVLEITESMASVNRNIPENLRILTSHGFSLALDDFGTAYANIDSVFRLPLSEVKLDRSILHVDDGKDNSILSSLVRIFRYMGLLVVAEGIDSLQAEAAAKEAGATHMQGFLFSKPQPVHAFAAELCKAARAAGEVNG